MSVPSGRRISVSPMPNTTGIFIDISLDNKLGMATLKSQFRHATGLKYLSSGSWVGVTIENNNFIIPESEHSFVVVTDTVDRARTIMNNNNLSMQLASCFGSQERSNIGSETLLSAKGQQGYTSTGLHPCQTTNYQHSNLRQNLSRKQSRTLYQKPKVQKEKVFKVVFVKQMDLPDCFSKDMVLTEGFVTVKSTALESEIIGDLQCMLFTSDIHCNPSDIVILSYSSKTLSIPCVTADFKWSLETLKRNTGQGKLYVMVNDKYSKDKASDDDSLLQETVPHSSSEEVSITMTPSTPATVTCQTPATVTHQPAIVQSNRTSEDFVSAGTPTVQLRIPLQRSSSLDPHSDSEETLPDIEIITPETTLRKRRSLKLKTSVSDKHDKDECKANSDSGDEDLAAAIQASLNDTGDPKDLLNRLMSQLDHNGCANLINVDRYDILDGARRGFMRKKFNNMCKLSVKFSGEFGIDDGGPSREFMRLALKAIRDSPIFEGNENTKMICPDLPSEERGDYVLFGRMLAFFIVHRGPCPTFFSGLMYNLIAGVTCKPHISDVFDAETRLQLKMIQEAEDLKSLDLPETLLQVVQFVGGMPLIYTNQKEKLLEALLEFILITRIKGVLAQFLDGLSCLNVLRTIRECPATMSSLFTSNNCPATAEQIEQMFKPVFSEEGSNRYVQELRTQSHWRDYLQDLEEKPDGLENLLQFVTGLDVAPVLGFDPSPELKFSHPDVNNPLDGTPYANTCSNSLTIPVLQSYEVFVERMNMALTFGTFFTNE